MKMHLFFSKTVIFKISNHFFVYIAPICKNWLIVYKFFFEGIKMCSLFKHRIFNFSLYKYLVKNNEKSKKSAYLSFCRMQDGASLLPTSFRSLVPFSVLSNVTITPAAESLIAMQDFLFSILSASLNKGLFVIEGLISNYRQYYGFACPVYRLKSRMQK